MRPLNRIDQQLPRNVAMQPAALVAEECLDGWGRSQRQCDARKMLAKHWLDLGRYMRLFHWVTELESHRTV